MLLGTRWFAARSVVVLRGEGAAVTGLRRLVNPPMSPFVFSCFSLLLALGVCLLPPQHVETVGCIGWLLYLYSGAPAYFVLKNVR